MEKVKCNLCESDNTELLFSSKDWIFYSDEKFNIERCKKCGLIFLNPRPTKDEIGKYYPDEYYAEWTGNEPYSFLKPKKVNMIKKFIKYGRVLDVGSYRGGFLLEMKKEGFEPYGIELSEFACNYAKTLGLKNIIHGDAEEINLAPQFFNVITLWNVLELTYDPQKLLCKLNKAMQSNGLLVVEVPNFGSIQSKIYKEKWFGLATPQHLSYFTDFSLSEMLRKAGFKVIKKSHKGNFYLNFVSFKLSLLRGLKLAKFTQNREIEDNIILGKRWYRGIARSLFNWFCIISSLILVYLRSSDIITIFSKKEK